MTPRNGRTLVVGIAARISGCANQKEVSLEDQVDHGKQVAAEEYDGPIEYEVIATKGKGERLDRPELEQIQALLRTGRLDLFIVEDIGRLVRGAEAVRLCGIAVDHGTRVLAPNDGIDTDDDHWEEDVLSACRDHVGHNSHTSRRLKQKLMNRFIQSGGATPLLIAGYLKPERAQTYDDWAKDPAWEPIYAEWYRRLDGSLNCSAVADWLNQAKVSTGPYARRDTWDGDMVRRLTANPILKGKPARGAMHTIKNHETGRRVSVKNPDGPRFKDYPHLAFWDEADFDRLNDRLAAHNQGKGRKPGEVRHPREGVPRSRTLFPGQHARCWYCGRICLWGGNGSAETLICKGSHNWLCWNSVTFRGPDATRAVVDALTAELDRLEGFDEQFRALVEQARHQAGSDLARRLDEIAAREAELARQKANFLAAIAQAGPQPMLAQQINDLENQARRLAWERRELQQHARRPPDVPASPAALRALFQEHFAALAHDSHEFAGLLRRVVPELHVYNVRLLDGGHLLPRARVKLDLAGLVPDATGVPGLAPLMTRELTLDLFEPPQREQVRAQAVRLTAEGVFQRVAARRLGVTQPVISQALALHRMMTERGLDTPYELVTAPPDDYTKLKRHRHPRYRFEPEQGYTPPAL
jgi:hypothetical protein